MQQRPLRQLVFSKETAVWMVAETNRPSRFHVKSPQVRDESHLWELMREALAVTTIALRAHVEKENLFPAHCLTLLASTLSPKEEKIVKNGEKKREKKCLLSAGFWAQHWKVQMTLPRYVNVQPLGQHCPIPWWTTTRHKPASSKSKPAFVREIIKRIQTRKTDSDTTGAAMMCCVFLLRCMLEWDCL